MESEVCFSKNCLINKESQIHQIANTSCQSKFQIPGCQKFALNAGHVYCRRVWRKTGGWVNTGSFNVFDISWLITVNASGQVICLLSLLKNYAHSLEKRNGKIKLNWGKSTFKVNTIYDFRPWINTFKTFAACGFHPDYTNSGLYPVKRSTQTSENKVGISRQSSR